MESEFFYQNGILRNVLPDELFNGNFEDIEYYYKHIGVPCYSLNYNDGSSKFLEEYSAPTLAVAQKWLRKIKGLLLYITPKKIDRDWKWNFWYIDLRDISNIEQRYSIQTFNTYEEALEAGIQRCLEMTLDEI